jgi:osmoprotectant transport system substrate-binding protein
MKKTAIAIGITGLALVLAGCAAPGSSSAPDGGSTGSTATGGSTALPKAPGSLTIGSADFPESDIIAHILADAMTAKGVKVTVHSSIGERPAYMSALQDGSIDAIPEYTGAIYAYLHPSATALSPADTYTQLQKVVAAKGFTVTDYAPAQDTDTVTVTKATAAKYHLTSIGDLKKVAPKMRLGAPAPFQTDAYGVKGMKKVYGVTFGQFVPLSSGGTITATALKNGTVDAANIFSTDPSIEKNGFVTLTDPKHEFPAQNVVPLFRNGVLTQPMKEAADAVAKDLTTADLRDLVSQAADGATSDTVATKWVDQHHLN